MFKKVSILIPYQPDHGHRDILFNWVWKFYKMHMPDAELCTGKSRSKLFSRSQAINDAAKKAKGDIFVIVDGDIIYDPEIIVQSIKALDKSAWVVPYSKFINLSEQQTQELLKANPKCPTNIEGPARKYNSVGGINVVPRKNFEKVHGFDERFVGWGREDDAFATAMNTLCGKYTRLPRSIYHLWHPRVGTKGNPNIEYNNELLKRYKSEKTSQNIMKLIHEKGH